MTIHYCDQCDPRPPASYKCEDCGFYYCEECAGFTEFSCYRCGILHTIEENEESL